MELTGGVQGSSMDRAGVKVGPGCFKTRMSPVFLTCSLILADHLASVSGV